MTRRRIVLILGLISSGVGLVTTSPAAGQFDVEPPLGPGDDQPAVIFDPPELAGAERIMAFASQVKARWEGRLETYPAIEGSFSAPLDEIGEIVGGLGWYGVGCGGDDGNPPAPQQDVRGKIALVARGDCGFDEMVANAQSAGSTGAIVFSDSRPIYAMTGDPEGITIPAVLIEAQPGQALRDLLVAGVDVTVTVGGKPSPFGVVDLCLRQEMEADGSPGGSVAIAIDGDVVYSRALGVKHLDKGGDVDERTLFRIGSITKMMTAAAVMTLAEAGVVDLDLPITTYLPGFTISPPWGASLITLHHLLTHSGGLPDSWGATDGRSLQQWVSDQSHVSLHAPPGSFYNYSNPSFILAGAIVESVSDTPFNDFVKARVWQPAGMPLTTLSAEEVLAYGNYATGHSGNARYEPTHGQSPFVGPAGLAYSTPTELVRWAQLLMTGGGTVLTPESVAAMTGEQIAVGSVPWFHYGYGITVGAEQRLRKPGERIGIAAHNGSYYGQRGILFWVPEQRMAVAALNNLQQDDLGETVACALRAVAGIEPIPTTGLTTSPSGWARYAGTYAVANQNAGVSTRHVEFEAEALHTIVAGKGPLYTPPVRTGLRQLYLDTFAFGNTGITFMDDIQEPGTIRWMRNRGFVGMRAATFPKELTWTGRRCAPLVFDAHMDISDLAVEAFGLRPIRTLAGQPVAQDAAGAANAGYRHELEFETKVPRLVVRLAGEGDDNLDLYVLHDADGDGAFTYPREVVATGATRTVTELVLAPTDLPAGKYQVWVHGVAVRGEDSSFDLAIDAVRGHDLHVGGIPDAIRKGDTVALTVCAGPVTSTEGPLYGVLLIDFGFSPRRIEIPIAWIPGPTIFLPATFQQGRGPGQQEHDGGAGH